MKCTIKFYGPSLCLFMLLGYSTKAQEDLVTFEKATTLVQNSDKQILMIFSGSDWCKPCIQLKKEILDTPSFQSFATKNLVVVYLDFPYRKKNKLVKEQQLYNEKMAEIYNPEGEFPKIILLNGSKEAKAVLTYKNGMRCEQFIQEIERYL